MSKLYWILWPSFLVAAVVEVLFFFVVNPQELYLFGEPVQYSPMATYSIGFFGFWAICAASSMATCFFQRPPADVNHPAAAGQEKSRHCQA